MSDLIGRTLGKYKLEEKLGAGGMALVFRSFHPQFHRPVAIKILPPSVGQDPGFRARFEREGRTIASLNHPNIVRVYDIDEHDGLFYMVMDLLPGGTLEDRLREGGLDRKWSADVIVRMAEALDYAHVRGVVHRDIKPSNILLDAEGQPVLADFGIARLVQGDGDPALTSAGMVMGTPSYMAPEQLTGQQADARADIYSLGIVLYQLLAGRAPFTGNTTAIISAHLTKQPPALRDYVPDLPAALDAVVLQALAKQPEHRFKSAAVFAQALRSAAADLEPGIVRVVSAASAATPAFGATLPRPAAGAGQPAIAQPQLPLTTGQQVTRYLPIILGVLGLLLLISLLARYWTFVVLLLILLVGGGFAFIYFRARSAGRKAAAETTRAITGTTVRAAAPGFDTRDVAEAAPPEQPAGGQPQPTTLDLSPTEVVAESSALDLSPTEVVSSGAPEGVHDLLLPELPALTEAAPLSIADDLLPTEAIARPSPGDLLPTEAIAQPSPDDLLPTEAIAQPSPDDLLPTEAVSLGAPNDVPEIPLPEQPAPTEAIAQPSPDDLPPTEAVPLAGDNAPPAAPEEPAPRDEP